jgi:hypothetical protein
VVAGGLEVETSTGMLEHGSAQLRRFGRAVDPHGPRLYENAARAGGDQPKADATLSEESGPRIEVRYSAKGSMNCFWPNA